MDPKDNFHSSPYLDHNQARFKHFSSLKLPVEGKSIVEMGAGIGDHTSFLLSLGAAEIVSLEARRENVTILKERFKENKNVTVRLMDLESPELLDRKFDIVYSYGLLYHLSNPVVAMKWIAETAKEFVVLETCVSSSSDSKIVIVKEEQKDVTQSYSGRGCRPGRSWIMNQLSALFKYTYVTVTQPDHPEFPLDWKKENHSTHLVRAVFVGSHLDFNDNKLLSGTLLETHLSVTEQL